MTTIPSYRSGTLVRTSVQFTLAPTRGGTSADPAVVTLDARKGDGTVVPLTAGVVRDATGRYHCDINVDVPGNWTIRWAGSGSGPNATELVSFRVLSSVLVPSAPASIPVLD